MSRVKNQKKFDHIGALYTVVLFVIFILFFGNIQAFAVARYEDTMFALFPSGERAYEYGNRHFDAKNKYFYDFKRAAYFFREAVKLDPNLPYIYHQLARVAFLRGDFPAALLYIDRQIADHGTDSLSSYYMRGLIEGYAGDYQSAVQDYKYYVESQANPDWAALNDYAWVLLKAGKIQEAADVAERGLQREPNNVWLLNSSSIALYELGLNEKALERAQAALIASNNVTERMWLRAYPGNDPKVAKMGMTQLRESIANNIHTIQLAIASSTIQ